jgi:transketolase
MALMGQSQAVDPTDLEGLHEVAQQIRVDGIRCSTRAGSGHPTSSMSAADIMTVLAARHLRYDWGRPRLASNDHLIFSKGHASPLLYGLYKACGAITDSELLTYRTLTSRLQGHPTPIIPWVDVATGSLGQGLPIATGVALAGKYLDKLDFHVWALCGDSELAEGSIWEALDKASHFELDNLCVIFDVNRLGQRGPTEFEWNLDAYRARVEAFGCRAILIDGHNLEEIDTALGDARLGGDRPTVVIAKTIKGKGFSEIEDKNGWHGKTLPADMAERAIAELGGERNLHIDVAKPASQGPAESDQRGAVQLPTYRKEDKVATRKAFGEALAALAVHNDVVALDAEVGNSTHAEDFQVVAPDRYFEVFIAEQQMVSMAVGLSVRGYRPFASTFAAFFSRAYDFIRMAGISGASIRLAGSHSGCEIGADGPSQMALEDLAAFRAIHSSTVLYPADPVSCANLVEQMAYLDGVSYIRTTRGAYATLYDNDEKFPIGGSKVLVEHGDHDQVTLIGAGITVHECLAAEKQLAAAGVPARVIDLYSIKPIDIGALRDAVSATGGRLVVAEDHYPQGGIFAAVLEALAADDPPLLARQCAVRSLPGSGPSDQLLRAAGIDADAIVKTARSLVGEAPE